MDRYLRVAKRPFGTIRADWTIFGASGGPILVHLARMTGKPGVSLLGAS